MTDVTGGGDLKGGPVPSLSQIKNHRRTIFAAKNPSLFRDSQLRSAVSLVCSIIVALRPCRKPLPKHFEKYFLTISPPFLIVNAPLFPFPPNFFAIRTRSKNSVSRPFPAVFPSCLSLTPENAPFILYKMTIDFIPLKLYVVKAI